MELNLNTILAQAIAVNEKINAINAERRAKAEAKFELEKASGKFSNYAIYAPDYKECDFDEIETIDIEEIKDKASRLESLITEIEYIGLEISKLQQSL